MSVGRQDLMSAGRIIALPLLLCASAAGATSSQASMPSQCPQHDIAGTTRCHLISVPEYPSEASGRHIDIEVMVLAARIPHPLADPLVVIPGGPGQSATRNAGLRRYFARTFDALRADRDIVLISPRGTAGSNELPLTPKNDHLFASLATVFPPEWARGAQAGLAKRAELARYTTTHIVNDLERIRAALGYERVNLYGTSYGTRVAQVYASRYPARVRSLVLKAPVPLGTILPLTYTPGAERALRLVFAECRAQTACAARYPAIERRFDALMTQLRASPAATSVAHPVSGAEVDLSFDDAAFGYLLRNVLMSASGGRTALKLIDAAIRGDFSEAASLTATIRRGYAADLAGGMALSVIASEDVPRITASNMARDRRSGFLRGAVAEGLLLATAGWPRAPVPPDVLAPLRSPVPTLLIAGRFDPATPPAFAHSIARGLPRSKVLVFRGGSHSGENFTGLDAIMTQFVSSGDIRILDTSAVDANRPVRLDAAE